MEDKVMLFFVEDEVLFCEAVDEEGMREGDPGLGTGLLFSLVGWLKDEGRYDEVGKKEAWDLQ